MNKKIILIIFCIFSCTITIYAQTTEEVPENILDVWKNKTEEELEDILDTVYNQAPYLI
ncbi:MAG: hypothetical protein US32_C0029G0006 [candidate division TM6 bacterium GW2011_GWA2_36_9]|nr:MAG: hypothetical protein US32_C0029G0006 [candidate division TM6 bacterium GW2011_GWA2_36_9]